MTRPDPTLLSPTRYRFVHEVPTRYADLDPNDHINNVAMAAVFEDGRVRCQAAMGLRRVESLRPMVASVGIDYLAQAHYPGVLACHVGVAAIGRSSWTLQQLVTQDDAPVATCRTVIVLTDGLRSTAMPDWFRATLEEWSLA
jgi:acyl-CoA thioester hydrolase